MRRFKLNFPLDVVLQPDGLPANAVQVFGPNAFPAIRGRDSHFGRSIDRFRDSFPQFNIGFYRLSEREREVNDHLEIIIWVERRHDRSATEIEEMEMLLLHGLRRWSHFREDKSRNKVPQRKFLPLSYVLSQFIVC